MDEGTNAALVRETLAGRREAFAVLVRRYQDCAYGVAVGMLSDFDLARDVVQEAFLCAYRDLSRLREPARFAGWLHGIVRHTAHRALRELERVRVMARELNRRGEASARRSPPDRSVEEAGRRDTVRRALQRLGEKNREAVSLYYVDGLSYADIAAFLDVPESTVQGRLQRGRAELRKELTMVRERFREEELPEGFAEEIRRLLDRAAEQGGERERAVARLTEIGAPAVDPLCEALDDPRSAVRKVAARALCAIGDARALQPVLRLLYSKELWRVEAVFRTGRVLAIPGVREALLDHLRKGVRAGQWEIVQALSHLSDDVEVRRCLLDAFRNPDPDQASLRREALGALCRIAPEQAVAFLSEALRSDDPLMRGAASWLAVRDGHLPPIDDCLKAFGAEVHWWGRICAANLVFKHGKAGVETLERVLQAGSTDARAAAAMALARTGSPEAFDVLLRKLLDATTERKWLKAVSRTMARHYAGRFAEWIEADPARLAGVPAVAWTFLRSGAEAGPVIEELLTSGTPSVRTAALRLLVRERGAAMLPELRRCLREGRPGKLAREAFKQMLRLGDAALPAAQEMLSSDCWTERKAAVTLLDAWGKLTPEQRAAASRDPHVAVREAAR